LKHPEWERSSSSDGEGVCVRTFRKKYEMLRIYCVRDMYICWQFDYRICSFCCKAYYKN
jgi:hypothetical protein